MLALGRADMQNARSVLLSKHNITFRRCICSLFLASVVVAILSANATLTLLNWPHIASLQEKKTVLGQFFHLRSLLTYIILLCRIGM